MSRVKFSCGESGEELGEEKVEGLGGGRSGGKVY